MFKVDLFCIYCDIEDDRPCKGHAPAVLNTWDDHHPDATTVSGIFPEYPDIGFSAKHVRMEDARRVECMDLQVDPFYSHDGYAYWGLAL